MSMNLLEGAMNVSDSHRRSIANVLRYTEETVNKIEAALVGRSTPGTLRHIEDDLTPGQKEKIWSCLHIARSLIVSLKDTLDLEVQTIPLSQVIAGATSTVWVTLIDTEPEHLKRYGQVPEDIRTALGRLCKS
jgi:hypothetical protein